MSTLYHTETGLVLPGLGEELTTRRRARKEMVLPATSGPGRLFVMAQSYSGNGRPLRISVNGYELEPVDPAGTGYLWYEAVVPANALIVGANRFEFWADADAMDAWSLGIEYGHQSSTSYLSTDAGTSWDSERIGHLYVGTGEYVVRLRLEEGRDPDPPIFVAGLPDDARAVELRRLLPPDVTASGDTLARLRALATWTSTGWKYRKDGVQYAPWDPLTILSWGKAGSGHDGREPIVFCVHYAVTFVAACVAMGIAARPAVFTEEVNGLNGHFAAEVWLEDAGRWILVDPNEDALFFDGDQPMTVEEVRAAGSDLKRHVQWGRGHAYQSRSPAMRRWIRDAMLTGACFRHRAVWPRSDFLARPERTPPSHGHTVYSELDLVWEASDLDDGLAMFRYFAEPAWFSAGPAMTR
jgi:transglutaminase superfamily protein